MQLNFKKKFFSFFEQIANLILQMSISSSEILKKKDCQNMQDFSQDVLQKIFFEILNFGRGNVEHFEIEKFDWISYKFPYEPKILGKKIL